MNRAQPRFAFIGGGNMARSMIGGLLKAGHPASAIAVGEPDADAQRLLTALGPITITADNVEALAEADLLILALKPQIMREVVSPLATAVANTGAVVMSIAAGVSCASLQRWLGPIPLIRCMPNTPTLVGIGAAGLYATAEVNAQGRTLAADTMNTLGIAVWVEEEALVDTVTGVSGSGPAYFFLMMEHMIAAGMDLGLEESTARTLVLQTALGAAHMAAGCDVTPAELRNQVTSPGGTTATAIAAFEEGGFGRLVTEALHKAVDRAAEITRELENH